MDKSNALVLWFDQLGIEDVPIVGGKNASLGEMYRLLVPKGVKIPNGFALTAHAYRKFLDANQLVEKIRDVLSDLNTHDMQNLAERGHKVRELLLQGTFPEELNVEIREGYKNLCTQYGEKTDVAVRSSATAEDLPDASFAGQQDTYLNIRGEHMLLDACKRCFASLFTNRAISYRQDKGFDHFNIALSVGIQKMVRSDMATSGVMFSIDTETGFKDSVLVTGAYGLGENVVQGAVNPDEFYVHKPTLKQGYKPIISRTMGSKEIKMIYDMQGTKSPTKNISVPEEDRNRYCLSDEEILLLSKWACIIEDHYSEKAGHFKPMDMEWAKDGITNDLFIVQARPETVQSRKDVNVLRNYVLKGEGKKIVTGRSVGSMIGVGKANVIKSVKDINKFKKGEVLITEMTDPDWEPIMKIASAIVTNRGGRTCHAAIISRELGIPCLVGSTDATDVIKQGQMITVDCSQGDEGYVYDGEIKFEIEEHDLKSLERPKTKIMMNIGTFTQAFEKSFIPNDGVGLAREEFIINSLKAHPLALLKYDTLKDEEVKKKLDVLTRGYTDRAQYFVDKLAEGVGMITAAFYPKPVIVRLSDFKSNEYASLLGGSQFEPKEDNPMIGWRGASRYYDDKYKEAFGLECKAMLKVRNEFGLKNLEIMIPFPRTTDEAKRVIETMASHGLKQGEDGLKVIGMCEIPSNVILADEFLDIFDGFSIGTNDLTQLTLGVDRDSELVAHVYDERNPAVKKLVKMVIDVANKRGKYIGICGQAPSDYPEFAEFVVECGIQTMSLNPDTVIKTTIAINELEKKLGIKK
ncbi:phosphoenolpyruvate synthase [Candidatus Woesearchaeota archaeon]|nr:phosphoenolpyruvate synthase [Candidatus Woesearchaeota archaeon]MCF7901541.1 phosphoenolpyruvate synthase [Candidatus Woesearchaeota archaeon]MCF8013963.1 phosphoenolpyruvate synthase [Candidatus Woesearchaeota archaeon]